MLIFGAANAQENAIHFHITDSIWEDGQDNDWNWHELTTGQGSACINDYDQFIFEYDNETTFGIYLGYYYADNVPYIYTYGNSATITKQELIDVINQEYHYPTNLNIQVVNHDCNWVGEHNEYHGLHISADIWLQYLPEDIDLLSPNIIFKDADSTVTLKMSNNLWPTWSTEESGWQITISETNKYWVECNATGPCGPISDTIIICNKAEVSKVSVSPETDFLEVYWDVDPIRVDFIDSVQIYCGNSYIATRPYTDGHYEHAINGSATSKTYRLKCVAYDGTISTLSAPKKSIKTIYPTDYFNGVNIVFNDVSDCYPIERYYISLYNNGNITHIDSIDIVREPDGTIRTNNPQATITRDNNITYTIYDLSLFDSGGYPIIEADFQDIQSNRESGKRKLFSNKSIIYLGIGENYSIKPEIYPNPANHEIEISGIENGYLTITMITGQQILKKSINGETYIEVSDLPSGLYFLTITANNAVYTKKIIIQHE